LKRIDVSGGAAQSIADASLGRALRPEDAAPDAIVIDTTDTTVAEVVAAIVERARSVADPEGA